MLFPQTIDKTWLSCIFCWWCLGVPMPL